jgi:glycerol uptake facilitator-like aquaporin
MEVLVAFVLVTFVLALNRSDKRSPGTAALLIAALLVSSALLSHKVA